MAIGTAPAALPPVGTLKRGLADLAARCGYSVMPAWRLRRWPSAQYLQRLFAWLNIDVVLDVGANQGQFRDFLRHEVGFEGLILSWEPLPRLAAALQDKARVDGRWLVTPAALDAQAGTARLHMTRDTAFSSFAKPTAETAERFAGQVEFEDLDIEARTLEQEMARLGPQIGRGRVYLKLDTQGHDLAVLQGGGAALQGIDALQSEVAVRPLYEGVPDIGASLARIQQLGFEPSAVFPNDDGHFPWLLELDMHFVARRHMPAAGLHREYRDASH